MIRAWVMSQDVVDAPDPWFGAFFVWWGLTSLLRRAGGGLAQWVRPAPVRHRSAGHRGTVNRIWTTIGTSPGRSSYGTIRRWRPDLRHFAACRLGRLSRTCWLCR